MNTPLRGWLADYLSVRRTLGFKLHGYDAQFVRFISYLEEIGVEKITIDDAVTWAAQPVGVHPSSWSRRLSMVRGFATYVKTLDPATEIPPADLLAARPPRATPYLYSDTEIAALLDAGNGLGTPFQAATTSTVVALLAATGMRVGEAIRLDRSDVDFPTESLTVRETKFGKSRELPLHPTTAKALRAYLDRSDRPRVTRNNTAIFVTVTGTRIKYVTILDAFHEMIKGAGLQPRSASCRPRLHDLRHTFAVRTMIDFYRAGGNVQARLPLLSTYLGHLDPSTTYWYLSAAPELMSLAGDLLQRHLGENA